MLIKKEDTFDVAFKIRHIERAAEHCSAFTKVLSYGDAQNTVVYMG